MSTNYCMPDPRLSEAQLIVRRVLARRPAPVDERDLEELLRILNLMNRRNAPRPTPLPEDDRSLPPEVWIG
jgi:hypothetical protein